MKKICFTALIFSLALSYAYAEEVSKVMLIAPQEQGKLTPLAGGIYGKISLDLRNIEINDALKYFALKTGLNIVTTKAVAGRVTLIVENVPVKDVFDIMLRSNGLAYDKAGDIYNVMSEEEYKVLYGKSFFDVRQVKIFRLKYAIPDQIFSLIDAMKSSVGRVLVDPESGSVLCIDSSQRIADIEKAIDEFEKENVVKIIPLNYAKAKALEEQLKPQIEGKKVGTIKADEQSNQLIIKTLPERMKEIESLIASLDKKTKEVLIDSKILKIKLTDVDDSGMQWEGLFEASEKNGLQYIGSYPFSSVASSTADWRSRMTTWQGGTTPGGETVTGVNNVGSYPFSGNTSSFSASTPATGLEKLHVGLVGQHDYDVLLNYLKTENKAKVLSNPKIAVVNNQEARIHVGERQAYVTTTTTTGQATSTVSEQVNFIDIGIQLSVTPSINEDGYVTLKFKSEVSTVVSTLVTPTNNKIPIVDTSLAETTVLVKDGSTIIIGGLRKEEKGETIQRTPILSKIPLLGQLFQTKQDKKDRTELLVMITPTIISGDHLVESEGRQIGQPNIKAPQDYLEVERRKKEAQTYEPAPVSDGSNMEIKGFKVYQESLKNAD